MKVGYTVGSDWSGNKYRSTAYLEEEVEPDVWIGVDKHTDARLKLKWDGEKWVTTT